MSFFRRQVKEVVSGGFKTFRRKILRTLLVFSMFPAVLLIRLIRPIILLRFDRVHDYVGHLSGDIELYLCAKNLGVDVPKQRYFDVFCIYHPVCNYQLLAMWKRTLRFWPAWIVDSILRMNKLIPGGKIHEIDTHSRAARDVHGWLDRCPQNLKLTLDEEARGEEGLRALGLPEGSRFICLLVRDNAYHQENYAISDRHLFRDADIDNYVLMAEKMAELGYYVVRMGAKVNKPLKSNNKKIIDYAYKGKRTELLDIYLGEKCYFCVTTGSGWDCIPTHLFRKYAVYTNFPPFSVMHSFSDKFITISKKHVDFKSKKLLCISDIIDRGVSFCDSTLSYRERGMELVENTPKEICDVTMEMVERLDGTWKSHPDDEFLQKRFWELFPVNAVDIKDTDRRLHGEIRARYGAQFLRDNQEWFLK